MYIVIFISVYAYTDHKKMLWNPKATKKLLEYYPAVKIDQSVKAYFHSLNILN